MAKPGRHKHIETPDKMWELFEAYRKEIKDKPITIVEQKKGNVVLPKGLTPEEFKLYTNSLVELPAQRPLTMEGFQNYLDREDVISDVTDYFENKDKRYNEYVRTCARIKREIRQDQIEGGMAGIYNPSITQRLNNLKELTETELKGGLNIPNLPDIGNRP